MYEMTLFTAGLPGMADLFVLPASLSPLALAPFVLSGVLALLLAFARRSDPGPRNAPSERPSTRPEAPQAGISAAARGSSSAWISRTGGPVRL